MNAHTDSDALPATGPVELASPATCPCCGQPVEPLAVLLDPMSGTVSRNGVSARLTPTEAKLFAVLIRYSPSVVQRDTLLREMYPDPASYPSAKLLDVMVCKIRDRVADLGLVIRTAWGRGYELRPAADVSGRGLIEPGSPRGPMSTWEGHHSKRAAELLAENRSVADIAAELLLPYPLVERHVRELRAHLRFGAAA